MADLSITAGNVIAASTARKKSGTAGATITAGQIVHLSPTTSRYILSDADAVGVGDITEVAIALNGASDGQPLEVATFGDVTLGSVLTAGTSYYLSPTAGGIAPVADLLTGDNVILLGVAKSATVLAFKPIISGVTLA
jgi:hypothetical protein